MLSWIEGAMKRAVVTWGLAGLAAVTAGTLTLVLTDTDREARAAAGDERIAEPPSRAFSTPLASNEAETGQVGISRLHTPAPGSPDRAALMDALRPVVEPELGPDVIFVVTELKVKDDWAFGVLEPVHRDGSPIAIESTPLAEAVGADVLDGLRTEAIWRKTSSGWRVEAHGIGATDVWFEPYCDRAPSGLISACAARLPVTAPVGATGPGGGMNRGAIDRLTTYAVLLGRGVGCGIDTRPQMARVGSWLDRVAPPGSSDQQIYLPMFMAGVEQNARAQSQGRSPDNCNTVASAIRAHPWP